LAPHTLSLSRLGLASYLTTYLSHMPATAASCLVPLLHYLPTRPVYPYLAWPTRSGFLFYFIFYILFYILFLFLFLSFIFYHYFSSSFLSHPSSAPHHRDSDSDNKELAAFSRRIFITILYLHPTFYATAVYRPLSYLVHPTTLSFNCLPALHKSKDT
jgi:hypothetical protein